MTDGGVGLRVLLVEDNPGDADLVTEYLAEAPGRSPSVQVAGTLRKGLELLREEDFDILLLDLGLPDSRGLETLESVLDAGPRAPVVVLTGQAGEGVGTEAVRRGAQDFLPKNGLGPLVLSRSIRHAVERWRIETALLASERKLRESYDRLEESSRLLRTTFDSLDAAVFVIEMETRRVLDCNRAAEGMFGYPKSEIVGTNARKLHVDEEHFHRFMDQLRPVLGRGETFRTTFQMRRDDGSVFPTQHVVRLLDPEDGRDTGRVVSVVRDITEKTEREKRLRFQAELLEHVGEAVIATDPEGVVVYWNRSAEELYGWSRDEALGTPIADLTVFPEDREPAAAVMESLRRGEVFRGDFRVRRKDGSHFRALVTNAPVLDEDGELVGIIGVSTDITDRARMERELAETNRALRVLSSSNRAVLESDSEDEILQEACRIAVEEGGYRFAWIGYAEADPGRTVRPVARWGHEDGFLEEAEVSWSDRETGRGPAGRAIRTREPAVSQDIASDPSLEPWREEALERGYRSGLAVPLLSDDRCLGAMMVYSDEPHDFDEPEIRILSELGADLAHGVMVHRTRRREREIEGRLRESEKLQTVGQLAGGVAHDFNNYLTVISTLTDLLLDEEELSGSAREDLEEIRAAAEGGAMVTHQLLTFGRRDVRRPQLLHLNETVRETMGMLDRLLGEAVEVELDLPPGLPRVHLDPGQLGQVIMNLALNGRDAMPEGGTLTIATRRGDVALPRPGSGGDGEGAEAEGVEREGVEGEGARFRAGKDEPHGAVPGVVLSVSDTGVGMDAETRRHVFEPFFSTKEGGTGLGLATVYGIVREAGGEVQVESEPGRGTTFRVLIPAVEGAEADVSEGPDSEPPLEGSETLLVLEDQEPVRRVMRRVLERSGFQVLTAASVEEAVRIGRERGDEISLLLSDVKLEDGTGPEAAERIREERPNLAVVFTSGYPAEELGSAFDEGPGPAFIQKPFEPEELVRLVRRTLDGSSG